MNHKTCWLTVVALMLLPGTGHAQTPRASAAAVTSRATTKCHPLRAAIRPVDGVRLSKRIVLVLDGSGSMTGQLSAVLGALNTIAGQPVDEMEIAVVVFRGRGDFPNGGSYSRWPGVEEKNLPTGWARLPSATATGLAVAWVACLGASGGTEPADALEHAVSERRDKLSVVFVSDGLFPQVPVLSKLRGAQRDRKRAGLKPAVIAVFGVGTNAHQQESLQAIAHAGSGGFWVRKPVPATHVLPRTYPARAGPPSPPPVQRKP